MRRPEMLLSNELQRSTMLLGLGSTTGGRQALPTRNRNEIHFYASFKHIFKGLGHLLPLAHINH